MTALRALSSALSLHEDPPSPPSDDFQFESEYVKSLLKERTPSPITNPHASLRHNPSRDKENPSRWRTPVTLGSSAGRTALAQRDMNSLTRSQSVVGITGEDTPVVKFSSYVSFWRGVLMVDNLPCRCRRVLGILDGVG